MHPPERVSVTTCIACGAMKRPGTCMEGCAEERLDLVPAADADALTAACAAVQGEVAALERAVAELAAAGDGDPEQAISRARELARAALHATPAVDDVEEAEAVITWWCPRCGGIDAPQPCLGVCVRPLLEWVNAGLYAREHERYAMLRDRERRLRGALTLAASVSPRPGQFERNLAALVAHAQAARAPQP